MSQFTIDLAKLSERFSKLVPDNTDNPEYKEIRSQISKDHAEMLKLIRSFATTCMNSISNSIELGNGFLVNRYSEAFVSIAKTIASLQKVRV